MNLLDVLEGNGWSIQQAIQTTFPFDPQFYSSYVRPRLQKRNCELPLVLVDGGRYEQQITSSDWREAPIGTDYLLEPVDSAGVFHPKINLFASERSVFYSISSANVTLEEYCKAAQIGYADGFQKDAVLEESEHVGDSYFLAKDVRDFYLDLLEQDGLITGQDAQDYITETAETLGWLDDISSEEAERNTWFISNLSGPILSQALDLLDRFDPNSEIRRARLYAPYYGTPNVLQRLATRLNADQLELLVESESTALEVGGLPDALHDFEYDIRRMEAHRSTRWVHGKFIVLEGPWGTACLYGSPNMTSSALLEGASSGNVEAGLFTIAPADSTDDIDSAVFDAASFQFDVSDPIDDPETLNLRSASYEGWESIGKRRQNEIKLEDARLTQPDSGDESELILTISGIKGTHEFTVRTDDGEIRTVEQAPAANDGELSVYLSAADRDVWIGSVITVEADGESSNPRRVVEQTQAYYREYREITRSAGTQSSNTLLRGILQNPDTAAISVFDIALSELQGGAGQPSDTARGARDDPEESYPERGLPNITTNGTSLPSLHSLVNQHLTYHRERAAAALDLDAQPQPADIEQFIEHAETFWETIELCFALEQLNQLDTEQVNRDRLFSNCESQLTAWFDQTRLIVQRLNGIIDQIENTLMVRKAFLGSSENEVFELGIWGAISEILFLHPGVVLEFEYGSAHSVFTSKNGLASRLKTIFEDIQTHIKQHVLNGQTLTQDVESLLENLSIELADSDGKIELTGQGIQALVLYILVQNISEDEFFDFLRNSPQFSGEPASTLAQFALQADETIVAYGLVSSLQWSIALEQYRSKVAELVS